MKAKLLVNGQNAPIGVNTKEVRLQIVTQGVEYIESIDYAIYETFDPSTPVFCVSSDSTFVYVDSTILRDCTEYSCVAEIYLRNAKKIKISSCFETGLSSENFSAEWIENPMLTDYVSEFEHEFTVTGKIDRARLYIVGLGFYQSELNRIRTDEDFYKPLLTDFDVRTGLNNVDYDEAAFRDGDKTICYDSCDILGMLKQGKNKLSVLVGPGWYCNTDKTITDPSFSFGTPKLIFEIHLYSNGKRKIIRSGSDSKVRNINRKSQLYNGDFVDFTCKLEKFISARICEAPKGRLIPSETAFDKIQEELSVVRTRHYNEIEEYTFGEDGTPLKTKHKKSVLEYDFGKVHTGGLHLKVKGKRGNRLTLRFYEVKIDGVFNAQTGACGLYDKSLGKYTGEISQRSEYVLSGKEDEIYPLFHWDCYRYVTLECDGEMPEIILVKSLFICSDVEKDGGFACSEPFFNKLYNAFVLTQRDNMHCGVPSDCPHREKLPYTGDGQLAIGATLYCFDSENFYRKWLKDIIASQRKDGWIPYTAPYIAGAGGAWWSNALTTVPLWLYRYTGDKEVLRTSLKPILRLLDFYNHSHEGDYIMSKPPISWYLGEWVTPDYTEVNISYINTLAHYTAICQTIEMCSELGEADIIEELACIKEKIKNAVNVTFLDEDKLNYCKGVQGENILPIINGIVPKKIKDALWNKVVEHYKEKPQFDTGIVMTPILLDALMEQGERELAYEIMTGKEEPSYSAMLKGATTLREHFRLRHQNKDKTEGKYVSHCHPMFGSVIPWVVKHIAGLDISELYAKKITIAPQYIDKVASAYAYKNTRFGKVSVRYRAEHAFEMKVIVPYGCNADVILPRALMNDGVCICEKTGKIIEGAFEGSEYKTSLSGGKYLIKSEHNSRGNVL